MLPGADNYSCVCDTDCILILQVQGWAYSERAREKEKRFCSDNTQMPKWFNKLPLSLLTVLLGEKPAAACVHICIWVCTPIYNFSASKKLCLTLRTWTPVLILLWLQSTVQLCVKASCIIKYVEIKSYDEKKISTMIFTEMVARLAGNRYYQFAILSTIHCAQSLSRSTDLFWVCSVWIENEILTTSQVLLLLTVQQTVDLFRQTRGLPVLHC